MFIILRKDEWDGLAIVTNHLGRPKQFPKREEAFDYCTEMEVCPNQIVEVTI